MAGSKKKITGKAMTIKTWQKGGIEPSCRVATS